MEKKLLAVVSQSLCSYACFFRRMRIFLIPRRVIVFSSSPSW